MYIYNYSSPLGDITLASNGHALTGLWFVGQKYYGEIMEGGHAAKVVPGEPQNMDSSEKIRRVPQEEGDRGEKMYSDLQQSGDGKERVSAIFRPSAGSAMEAEVLPVFRQTASWLDIYFSGKEPDFMPEVSLSGSPFQMEVWEILKTIPYGQTVTYGAIAAQISAKRGSAGRMSAQAVGGAVSRNPVSILVPCHRVVGASGSLTGYAGGMARKTSLLKMEGVDMAALFRPKML